MRTVSLLLQWSARLTGLALFLLVLIFAVGEGVPPPSAMSAAFVLTWLGLIVLWRWSLAGGLAVVIGMGAFCAINVAQTGKLPGPWLMALFVPGILAIAGWCLQHGKTLAMRTRGMGN